MATTYSATEYSDASAPSVTQGDRVIPFKYTVAPEIVTGDKVNLCKYSSGLKPVAVHVKTSAGVATTGGSFKLGTNDGTTDDDDSLVAATTATGAITVAATIPVTPTRSVDTTTVYATLTGTSTFATGLVISGFVVVSPFKY